MPEGTLHVTTVAVPILNCWSKHPKSGWEVGDGRWEVKVELRPKANQTTSYTGSNTSQRVWEVCKHVYCDLGLNREVLWSERCVYISFLLPVKQ